MFKKYFFRAYLLFVVILFSQFPLFVNQYIVRLESHLKENQRTVLALEKAALSVGKSLPEYIQRFISSQDPDFHSQGIFMKDIEERNSFLQEALDKLVSQSAVLRPFYFFLYADKEIVEETKRGFHFGFVWSEESVVWALLGGITAGVVPLFARAIWRRRRKNEDRPSTIHSVEAEVQMPSVKGDI